eukprot:GHVU01131385.1.p1 GENE.GHVU01131385.1~~GHVU01131385.1.p1  ORF type:complete len:107 (+),score=4.30 GHVU01131385.1:13-333(+)
MTTTTMMKMTRATTRACIHVSVDGWMEDVLSRHPLSLPPHVLRHPHGHNADLGGALLLRPCSMYALAGVTREYMNTSMWGDGGSLELWHWLALSGSVSSESIPSHR